MHLPVSKEGTVDLEHLRDAAYGCVADKKLLTVVASELCPITNIAHWSWKMQLQDGVMKFAFKDLHQVIKCLVIRKWQMAIISQVTCDYKVAAGIRLKHGRLQSDMK